MNVDRVRIRKLSTGVPGLDEVLGGGIPEYSLNLIVGGPGCGKTTLGHQILFANATPEQKAIYFTIIGEPPMKMLRYQQKYAFFDTPKVNDAIRFVHLGEEARTGGLAAVFERIQKEVEETNPALVAVDSFRSVIRRALADSGGELEMQDFVQQLALHLTNCEATTFLLGEYSEDNQDGAVFTVADGLIWLYQAVDRNSVVRKINVTKMRGQG
jgi:circadian clock protein KaiC